MVPLVNLVPISVIMLFIVAAFVGFPIAGIVLTVLLLGGYLTHLLRIAFGTAFVARLIMVLAAAVIVVAVVSMVNVLLAALVAAIGYAVRLLLALLVGCLLVMFLTVFLGLPLDIAFFPAAGVPLVTVGGGMAVGAARWRR